MDSKKPKNMPPSKKNTVKTVGFFVILALIGAFIWASSTLQTAEYKKNELSYSQLNNKVNKGEVESVQEEGSELKVTLKDALKKDNEDLGKKFVVVQPKNELRDDQKIDISKTNFTTKEPSSGGDVAWGVAQLLVPGILILG